MGMVRRTFRRLDKEDFLLIYSHIQNVYPESHRVLYPGVVTALSALEERHTVLGKGAKVSNKDGTWTSSLTLLADTYFT